MYKFNKLFSGVEIDWQPVQGDPLSRLKCLPGDRHLHPSLVPCYKMDGC